MRFSYLNQGYIRLYIDFIIQPTYQMAVQSCHSLVENSEDDLSITKQQIHWSPYREKIIRIEMQMFAHTKFILLDYFLSFCHFPVFSLPFSLTSLSFFYKLSNKLFSICSQNNFSSSMIKCKKKSYQIIKKQYWSLFVR